MTKWIVIVRKHFAMNRLMALIANVGTMGKHVAIAVTGRARTWRKNE